MKIFQRGYLLILLYTSALASAAEVEILSPVALSNFHQYSLHSNAVNENYRIDVKLPSSYGATDRDFPIVYMMDANSMFAVAAAEVELLQSTGFLPQFILVGVGYDLRGRDPQAFLTLRYRDMSHIADPAMEDRLSRNPPPFDLPPGSPTGEVEAFIEFIQGELKPFIEAEFQVDTNDQSILGHSLGGNFALYALLKHPSMFDRYVIGSPGLHWGAPSLLDLEAEAAETNKALDKHVYISVGDREDDFDLDNSIRQITNTRELYNRLRSNAYDNLTVNFELFQDRNHITVIPETIARGLLAVFAR